MSVIEGLIVQIINRAAGSFVKDVDSSKLSASLWSGECCPFVIICVLPQHGTRILIGPEWISCCWFMEWLNTDDVKLLLIVVALSLC